MAKPKIIKSSSDYASIYAVRDPFWPTYWDVNTRSNTVFTVDEGNVDQYIEILTKIKKNLAKKENN